PLALSLLTALLADGSPLEMQPAEVPPPQAEHAWPVVFVIGWLDLFAIAMFNVAWYRFLLGYGLPRLWPGVSRTQLRTLCLMLLLALVPAAPLLLLIAFQLSPPLVFGLCLIALYLSVRWSLVLPATAVGVRLTFQQSWRATAGKALPLFFAPFIGAF